mgnify:CR=1 FL=1
MVRIDQCFFKWVSIFLLLFSGSVIAQVAVSAAAENPVHFANTDNFSAGMLTITFNMPAGKTSADNMPAGKTSAEVEVTLADGIQYVAASENITGGSVTLKAGSTNTKPVFNLLYRGYACNLENQTKGYQSCYG